MAQSWKTIKIFISSTFKDMNAERDHLVRVVFPELKERCRTKHVQLVDVDLRWGVTEKQAVGGGALDICLDEIDSCRPYFLGLLGRRYGYVPPGYEHSITAEEIYHGVLHNNLPRQLIDLHPFVEGILESRALFKEQVSCLVRAYLWNPEKRKYLLNQDITPGDEKTLRSIFNDYSLYRKDRSFFFFRSESFTRKLAGANSNDYFEIEETLQNKLEALKQQIKDAGLPWFEYDDLETFGEKVKEILWRRIDTEFPEKKGEIERDWLKEEVQFHELFMADRTRRFIGRSDILKKMHDFIQDDKEPRVMVITGDSGSGKSALIARFTEEAVHKHPDWLIIPHFVGASPSSTNIRQTLRKLCRQLNQILGIEEAVPEEYKELAQLFPELLQRASEIHRILFIIDALNQLEKTDNAHTLRWVPQELPQNVKLVVSTLASEALDTLKSWRIQPRFEDLSGLTESEVREFVESYLKEIRKEFPKPEIRDAFYEKVKAGNPLYILVALEELRVFPVYEEVGKRVASLPDTVPELFAQVLERVEGDFSPPLVQDFLSLIACGRQGMIGEELQTLLKGYTPVVNPDAPPSKLPDMLFARLRRAFSAYLFERSGVIDLFHAQLKEAVGKRYLADEPDRDKVHRVISAYFEQRWTEPYLRALDELPHQLTKAKDWDGVEQILCDLKFIEAKCANGMTYELIHDYSQALDYLPEAQPEKVEKLKREARLKKYTEDLIAYAKGEIDHLDILPSIRPWSDEELKQDAERIINNPTRMDRILAFSQFVNSEGYSFIKFATHPGFVIQQAYNYANSGPIANPAEKLLNEVTKSVLVLRISSQRPEYFPNPSCSKNIEIPNVSRVSLTPDGRLAITARTGYMTADGKVAVFPSKSILKFYDIDSGQCIKRLDGTNISSAEITSPSNRIKDRFVVWDVENEICLHTVDFTSYASIKSLTPDGRKAMFGDSDGEIEVWDVEQGKYLRTLKGHTDSVTCVSVSADGKRAVSGSRDKTLRVWDIESGECIKTLFGHEDGIECVSLTPLGNVAISASLDKTLKVWEVVRGKCIRTLKGHLDRVRAVSITPDGKRAVSGGDDDTMKVWDVATGQCLRTFFNHSDSVQDVCCTLDGTVALSAGGDMVKVWNIENGQSSPKRPGYSVGNRSTFIGFYGPMAISSNSRGELKFWNSESGEHIRTLKGHSEFVSNVILIPDRMLMVSGSWDGKIKIWEAGTGKCTRTLQGHSDDISMVRLTPDGKRVVSGSMDRTLRVWDIKSGQLINRLEGHTDGITTLNLTNDGRRAVSSGYDGTPRVWDLENGCCLNTLQGHELWPIAMDISADDSIVVSASFDNTLKLWNLESGECFKTLEGHEGEVMGVCLTPEGKRAVSVSSDDTVKVWDILTGKCLRTFRGHSGGIHCLALTHDGREIISGGRDKSIRIWSLEKDQSLAFFQSDSKIQTISTCFNGHFAINQHDNEVGFLSLRNVAFEFPIVTPTRIWLFGLPGRRGTWDTNITTNCLWCNQRFPVLENILDVIRAINRNAHLSPNQSPCLELPDTAWDEPRLLSECPLCHKPLKFSPFIVDNKGRH
jgi:WD40 repeat protein